MAKEARRPIQVTEKAEVETIPALPQVRHKVLVMSGKGGVGKTTVTVNLAMGLVRKGYSVGVLDADIHGPTVPKMLGMGRCEVLVSSAGQMLPAVGRNGVKVLSIAFLLQDPNSAVIWRGPMKMAMLKKFVEEATWGELDFLLVDLPPGTGDEPLSVAELLPQADGAVIVSTPQEVALQSVRKSISFARTLGLRVLGVIENMSGFVCPKCGEITYIFGERGAKEMAETSNVPFLGSIPLDIRVERSGEQGKPIAGDGNGPELFDPVVEAFLLQLGESPKKG